MPDRHIDSVNGQLSEALVHELRTSLSMIMGFAELLETREDPETRSEATRGITQAARRLQTTIDSMLGREEDHPAEAHGDRPSTMGRHRLMVIDDDPSELELLRAAFPPDSFDMVEIRDADSGFQILESVEPDVVILDWMLSGGGAETLAELKLRNPYLPVIVLADHGDPSQRQIATLLDADEFITRPVDAVELLGKTELLASAEGLRRRL
jgi:CheY-like chemotaxis protein